MVTLRASVAYRIVIWVALVVASVLLMSIAAPRFQQPDLLYHDDYVEYWAAGRLNLTRGNPYSPSEMMAVEMQAGRLENIPLMMWNPPWTLAVAMPFAVLPYGISRVLWLLSSLAVTLLAADWLWCRYAGSRRLRWVAWGGALTFGPALQTLKVGQITPLLLLGVAGFLWAIERRRWWLAGVALASLTIKPHLLYLLVFTVMLWLLNSRRISLVIGLSLTLVAALGISMVVNPQLLHQYFVAVTQHPPAEWITPTLGRILRSWVAFDLFYLQFVPAFLGCVWATLYWRRRRDTWCWAEELPLLILVSVATAPYGWNHDQIVSLAAVIPVLAIPGQKVPAPLRWTIGCLYVLVNGIVLFAVVEQAVFWWLASWLLIWWWVLSQLRGWRNVFHTLGGSETVRE